MKDLFRLNEILILTLILIILNSCQKTENEYKIKKDKLSGYVQKGPYINGTTIQMYELNSSLSQTGKTFNTQITNNRGLFEINDVALSSQFVEFLASGYYFNEITGNISPSLLSLYALSDITDISTVNVNILTHLEKSRVEYLIGKGMDFSEAKDTAQKEVLKIFGFSDQDIDDSEMLDISADNEGNAILLAISVILQGNRPTGDLTELLANISNDIKQDGKVNDANIIAQLRSSSEILDLPEIRVKLGQRYQDIGINATIPGFENYITDFLSVVGSKPTVETKPADNILSTLAILHGLVNANNLSTVVSFDYGTTNAYGNTVPAVESPATGNSNTQVHDTIAPLTPNTLYHFRVKAINAIGTSYGSDLTFKTSSTK
jgi:hypothetical protein